MKIGRRLRGIATGYLTPVAIALAVSWLVGRLLSPGHERRGHDESSTLLSGAGQERPAEQEKSRPRAAAHASRGGAAAQSRSALRASGTVVAASYHLLSALRKLAVAEGRVFRANTPLLFLAGAALAAFGGTLWLCLAALIGWLLMAATGSLALALGLLIVIHALLVLGVAPVLLYSLRQAAFPQTRSELRLLGRTLRYDLDRATGAVGDPLGPLRPRASPTGRARYEVPESTACAPRRASAVRTSTP